LVEKAPDIGQEFPDSPDGTGSHMTAASGAPASRYSASWPVTCAGVPAMDSSRARSAGRPYEACITAAVTSASPGMGRVPMAAWTAMPT
jgi:hypothetical protein